MLPVSESGLPALDHVRLVEIERDYEKERSGPPVHRVKSEHFLVADEVADEPDQEPEQSHERSISDPPIEG